MFVAKILQTSMLILEGKSYDGEMSAPYKQDTDP